MSAAFPHEILVKWSDEDECYVARVHNNPSYRFALATGDSPQQAVRELVKAIRENNL